MRILSFFLRAIISIGCIAAFVYFIGGSMWLAIGSRQFITDIKKVESFADNSIANAKRCQGAPASSSFSQPKAIQLRFLDKSSYVIELICTLIETTPVEVDRGTLPFLITKDPGSSGLYVSFLNPQPSTVSLRSLRATKAFVFSGKLQATGAKVPATLTGLPQTACVGWGYQCCDPQSEMGTGKQQSAGVSDCPSSCYSVCAARPYLLSFVADPYPTEKNEILMTSDSLAVTFSYAAEVANGTISSVSIDYGDGKTDTADLATGVFTHTYSCRGPCRYQASITAKDAAGNSSVASENTTLYIVKR